MIEFSTLTIPTPEPYDDKDENRQRENFFFVANQILTQAKAQGMTLSDLMSQGTLTFESAVLEELRDAVKDLQFNSMTIDFGPFQLQFDGRTFSLGEIT